MTHQRSNSLFYVGLVAFAFWLLFLNGWSTLQAVLPSAATTIQTGAGRVLAQPTAVISIVRPTVSAPTPDVQATADTNAAQVQQPDDYTEMTKPNTRILPTLEPIVVKQVSSPTLLNEGTKPVRHKLP